MALLLTKIYIGKSLKQKRRVYSLKKLKGLLLLLVLVMAIGALAVAQEYKEFTQFCTASYPDYPGSTILGDIIEKETGIRVKKEFMVGDLETRLGLMIASGEYPDIMDAAHYTQRLLTQVLIFHWKT